MGWVTLTLRKEALDINGNNLEMRDLQLSRNMRVIQKNLSYEQSVFNKSKKTELAKIKADYDKVKDARPVGSDGKIDTQSEEYATWQQEYATAKEEYESAKLEIENYWTDQNNSAEEESTDRENEIKDEQTTVEAQLESNKTELEVVKEQISTDIDQSKLDLA